MCLQLVTGGHKILMVTRNPTLRKAPHGFGLPERRVAGAASWNSFGICLFHSRLLPGFGCREPPRASRDAGGLLLEPNEPGSSGRCRRDCIPAERGLRLPECRYFSTLRCRRPVTLPPCSGGAGRASPDPAPRGVHTHRRAGEVSDPASGGGVGKCLSAAPSDSGIMGQRMADVALRAPRAVLGSSLSGVSGFRTGDGSERSGPRWRGTCSS